LFNNGNGSGVFQGPTRPTALQADATGDSICCQALFWILSTENIIAISFHASVQPRHVTHAMCSRRYHIIDYSAKNSRPGATNAQHDTLDKAIAKPKVKLVLN
jgi:hypothetical protein